MIFEEVLFQYGIAGVFIAYLIYDRQVLVKRLVRSIDELTDTIRKHL